MKKWFVWMVLAGSLTGRCVADSTEMAIGTVIAPVALEDAAATPLPSLNAGDRLICIGQSDHGYQVTVRDADGKQRYGLLPFRDIWGHAMARDWRHHLDLPAHVIELLLPATLAPTAMVLPAGVEGALVRRTGKSVDLRWACGDIAATFRLPRAAVALSTIDPSDERERLEQSLEAAVGAAEQRNAELTSELTALEAHVARVEALMGALTTLALDNAALEGERAVAEQVSAALEVAAPTVAETRDDQARDLRKGVQKQVWPARQAAQLSQETQVLEAARERLAGARVELGELQLRVVSEKARRDALKAGSGSAPEVEKVIQQSAALHQRLARGAARGVSSTESAAHLLGLLDMLQEANEMLIEELQYSRGERAARQEQLAAISAQIQQLQTGITQKPQEKTPPTHTKPPATPSTLKPARESAPREQKPSALKEQPAPKPQNPSRAPGRKPTEQTAPRSPEPEKE